MSCDTLQIQTAVESGVITAVIRELALALAIFLGIAAMVLLRSR